MKRVLWGSLFVFIFQLGFTPVTNAAEIPPSAECTSTFETMYRTLADEMYSDLTDKERRQADRRFVNGLVDAGCVSAAEPLLKPMKAKPFAPECAAAAASAESFWAPATSKIKPLIRAHKKTIKPLRQRFRKVSHKLTQARQKDGHGRQVKRLYRKREKLSGQIHRNMASLDNKGQSIVAPDAYASTLVLYELISLRCVGSFSFEPSKPVGPAAKALRKNQLAVWYSTLYVMIKSIERLEAGVEAGPPKLVPTAKAIAGDELSGAAARSLLRLP